MTLRTGTPSTPFPEPLFQRAEQPWEDRRPQLSGALAEPRPFTRTALLGLAVSPAKRGLKPEMSPRGVLSVHQPRGGFFAQNRRITEMAYSDMGRSLGNRTPENRNRFQAPLP